MRYTLWLYLVFACAVSAALFFGANDGAIAIFWPPIRLDVSLNLALLVIVLAFAVVQLAWLSLAALLRLPEQARQWRQQQKEKSMHHALLMGQCYLLAGRYSRGKKAATHAMNVARDLLADNKRHPETLLVIAVGHIIAARCCHHLSDTAGRDAHLESMQKAVGMHSDPQLNDAAVLQAAQWALEDANPALAFELIERLSPGAVRRTFALKIRLRASQLAGQIKPAFETAQLLVKHKAFSSAASDALLRGLAIQTLGHANDLDQLLSSWQRLSVGLRAQIEVAGHAVTRLAQLNGDPVTARNWLETSWDQLLHQLANGTAPVGAAERLVEVVSAHLIGLDSAWLARIESAHNRFPNLPVFRYLAGLACFEYALWGKAESLLWGVAPALLGHPFERSTWCMLALLSERKKDEEQAKAYFRKAALIQ